jgi:hypothetical protein
MLMMRFTVGLITIEGSRHALQRKIIHPTFNSTSINTFWPTVLQISEQVGPSISVPLTSVDRPDPSLCASLRQLGDVWSSDLSSRSSPRSNGYQPFGIASTIERTTFDLTGLVSFDHAFNCLKGETDELYNAFQEMIGSGCTSPSFYSSMSSHTPFDPFFLSTSSLLQWIIPFSSWAIGSPFSPSSFLWLPIVRELSSHGSVRR